MFHSLLKGPKPDRLTTALVTVDDKGYLDTLWLNDDDYCNGSWDLEDLIDAWKGTRRGSPYLALDNEEDLLEWARDVAECYVKTGRLNWYD